MLALHENEIPSSKKISIRYDNSTRTYYCFYHKTDHLLTELIFSYELNEGKWIIETNAFKNIFETKFNQLFQEKNIPFEEQIRYVIDYLDTYFGKLKSFKEKNISFCIVLADQTQQRKMKINVINQRKYILRKIFLLRISDLFIKRIILFHGFDVYVVYVVGLVKIFFQNNHQVYFKHYLFLD
jgi:hypothetical protein